MIGIVDELALPKLRKGADDALTQMDGIHFDLCGDLAFGSNCLKIGTIALRKINGARGSREQVTRMMGDLIHHILQFKRG